MGMKQLAYYLLANSKRVLADEELGLLCLLTGSTGSGSGSTAWAQLHVLLAAPGSTVVNHVSFIGEDLHR